MSNWLTSKSHHCSQLGYRPTPHELADEVARAKQQMCALVLELQQRKTCLQWTITAHIGCAVHKLPLSELRDYAFADQARLLNKSPPHTLA